MTRSAILGIVCVLILPITMAFVTAARSAPKAERERPVSLKEIQDRGVEGTLSPRLGTVVEVSGHVVPNTSRAKAYVDEPFFLRIEEVDGRKLEEPWEYSATDMPLHRTLPGLKMGAEFRCAGYESGRFDGLPDGEAKYGGPRAGTAFHLVLRFEVLKVISPTRTKK